ncbi:hypothetical protein QN277_014198 [Acacia crassicarpa]|uniref:Uncharacterized protein n=1 Tax=Acacia crassicarpa TaxID=499986 RepID=A0AAE1TF93_9FABA|nr:hypothetical protein QN277_014198 [Acacia crassicarpa]
MDTSYGTTRVDCPLSSATGLSSALGHPSPTLRHSVHLASAHPHLVFRLRLSRNVNDALITAYAACGQLEKAKQVVLDQAILAKSLNEIKCALLSTLASDGQLSAAAL